MNLLEKIAQKLFTSKSKKEPEVAKKKRMLREADLKKYKSISLTVKETSGHYRWAAIVSGGFGPDRDGQWVTTKALSTWADKFMSQKSTFEGIGEVPCRYTAKGEPELVVRRYWHCGEPDPLLRTKGAGIDIGYADYAQMVGEHHLLISGLYFDDAVGAAFAEKEDQDGNSIGFFHPKTEPINRQDFHNIDVFDVSVLPSDRASYPFTAVIHA